MTHIYALLNPTTSEIRYVGKTVKLSQRYNEHCTDKKLNHKACWVRSLGQKPELVELECVDGDWFESERWWISYFKFLGANLVNSTSGGEGTPGYSLPKTAREKIGEANRRRVVTAETRMKISIAGRGRKHTAETKSKIGSVHRGKVTSEETKLKISQTKMKKEKK